MQCEKCGTENKTYFQIQIDGHGVWLCSRCAILALNERLTVLEQENADLKQQLSAAREFAQFYRSAYETLLNKEST